MRLIHTGLRYDHRESNFFTEKFLLCSLHLSIVKKIVFLIIITFTSFIVRAEPYYSSYAKIHTNLQSCQCHSKININHLKSATEVGIPVKTREKKTHHSLHQETGAAANIQVKKIAGYVSQTGNFLANRLNRDRTLLIFRGMATSQAGSVIQQWLSHFGTARVQLSMDRHGNWNHSSGDLLIPLYDNCQSLFFMQGGVRKSADHLTENLGYGVRTFWHNGWMFGDNFFYDNDFTGHNRRIGFGIEAWRDYYRLSANIYRGTTKWHKSRDFDGTWQEKPADGYDVRVEGWLPAFPQLGGKFLWEQYSGKQVALFDKEHLQQNPHAFTATVQYTPIPLITLCAEQRRGRGQHDTQVALSVNWSLGHDWRWQLDPENVQNMRTLAGSRYDLVDRNNNIVMQYRKAPELEVAHLLLRPITNNSPADGVTRNILQVLATNNSGKPVRNAIINWLAPTVDASVNLAVGSLITDENGLATVALTSTKAQTVMVTAQSNGISATLNSYFVSVVSKIKLDVLQDNAVADGRSANTVVATLTDSQGRPVAGQKITWALPDKVSTNEKSSLSDNRGKATVHLTATAVGNAVISAAVGNLKAQGIVHFIGNNIVPKISSLIVIIDGSQADGKAINVAQVLVTDVNGNPLSGQTVTWNADKPTVAFAQSALTDKCGKTSVAYTDTVAESLTLTAKLANGHSATAISLFIADNKTARLKALTVSSGAKASGDDKNIAEATVTDYSGNPVPKTTVTFSATGSAKLSNAIVNTDSNGQALVTLTDTVAETVQVTAKLASGGSLTKDSSFSADLDSAVLSATATTGALADGNATNTVTIMLKNKSGIALAGQDVSLRVDGRAKLSASSGITDRNGLVQATLADTVAETVTVTASLRNGKSVSAQSAFISYAVTELSASTSSVKANGRDTSTLTAIVKDSIGNIVPNTPVAFTVTGSAKLSATSINTDSSGQAQVLLSDTVNETVSVTAKSEKNSSDGGKAQNVNFEAPSITAVGVRGTEHTFFVGQGFPQTGFAGAQMYFLIDGSGSECNNYTWTSNRSWVTVDSDGIATMNGTHRGTTIVDSPPQSEREVTITASPKAGGKALTYSFRLQKWYERSIDIASVRTGGDNEAGGACIGLHGTIESASDMSDGAVSVVGKLFGEWRDSPALKYRFYWDAETTTTWRAKDDIAFIYRTGVQDSASQPGATYVMCRLN